jgi:hypothetical protein
MLGSLTTVLKTKALHGCARLSLVAGVDEISDFDLLRDLVEVTSF